MRAALFEYLRLLWRLWWQLLIGVGFGIFGAALLNDMEMIEASTPSWGWYLLAIGTFACGSILRFLTRRSTKPVSTHRATPNMTFLSRGI